MNLQNSLVAELMSPNSRDAAKVIESEGSFNEPLDGLSIELGRISAEIQSINSGFQAQMQLALSEVRTVIENEYRARFDKALANLRQQLQAQIREELEREFHEKLQERIERVHEVQCEIERIDSKLEGVANEINVMLDDPTVELSKVMRRRTEQAELRAFLEGLRFSIADRTKVEG